MDLLSDALLSAAALLRRAEAAAAAAEAAEAAGDAVADDDAPAAAAAADLGIPRGIVKRVMLLDPEVQRASADSVWLVGEATRLFLQALGGKAAAEVSSKKRKTIMLQDFETLIRSVRTVLYCSVQRCSVLHCNTVDTTRVIFITASNALQQPRESRMVEFDSTHPL
jgi:histone H3/H4